MAKTNSAKRGDKMLEAVLLDEKLMKFGGYEPQECLNLDRALVSDNCIVSAVAKIIERTFENGSNPNEIYKEVSDYLKKTI